MSAMPQHADADARQLERHRPDRERRLQAARRNEAARQHGQQVRAVDHRNGGGELVDDHRDVALAAEPGHCLVDEAVHAAMEADAHVARIAVAVERQLGARQRVAAPHHADILAFVEHIEPAHAGAALGRQRSLDIGKEAERDVGLALLEQRPRVARRQRQHLQLGLRLLGVERRDQRRHQHRRGGVGHRQHEAAHVAARIEVLRIECIAQPVERLAHRRPHRLGMRRGRHAGRAGDEQLLVRRVAQPPQRVADRRLRHRELRCRAGHVAFDHQHVEDAQEVEVERAEVHRAFAAVMAGFRNAIGGICGLTPIFAQVRLQPRFAKE